jgi:bacterioferritin
MKKETKPTTDSSRPFMTDIETLRRRAREHIEQGAVTQSYDADRDTVIQLLNDALATEIVCNLRYRHHYFIADGLHAQYVKEEFMEHANEELQHADQIAERIRQLGGNPDFNPANLLTRSHAQYDVKTRLTDLIQEDLIAERIAIDSYREIVQFLGQKDPTSRRLMEEILAKEEEHADDLSSLLSQVQSHSSQTSAE